MSLVKTNLTELTYRPRDAITTGDELATSKILETEQQPTESSQLSQPTSRRKKAAATSALLTLALSGSYLIAPPASQAADRVEAFIAGVAPMAQQGQRMFGVPASVAIAQAILESGWGESTLSKYGQAYFGVKCSSTPSPYQDGCINMSTWEVFNGVSVTVVAPFRTYSKVSDSFLDHGHFLRNNSRYAPAFQTNNADDFARAIHRAGYATDPSYAQKIINIINANNLRRFDNLNYHVAPAGVEAGIGQHWRVMSAEDREALGNPRSAEMDGPVRGARMVAFNSGIIAWHPTYGSHAIFGKMWNAYRLDSDVRNALGYPTSERFRVDGGWNQNFERGRIYEDQAGKTTVLSGAAALANPLLTSSGAAKWNCKPIAEAGLGKAVGNPELISGVARQRAENGDIYCISDDMVKVSGAIVTRHRDVNAGPWLGLPKANEYDVPGGATQEFKNGTIYWNPEKGIFAVRDGVYSKYRDAGSHARLGLPISEEQPLRDGAVQNFVQGDIYWHDSNAAVIRDGMRFVHHWEGGVNGIGWPLSDEQTISGVAKQSFTNADVFWTGDGPIKINNAFLYRYRELGAERVGAPLGPEEAIPGGSVQRFMNADFYWNAEQSQVYVVTGGIREYYRKANIGLPTSDEQQLPGGVVQSFKDADIYWSTDTGCHVVGWGMRTGLFYNGGVGKFGFPTGSEEQIAGGSVQHFSNGPLYYHAATGAISTQAPPPVETKKPTPSPSAQPTELPLVEAGAVPAEPTPSRVIVTSTTTRSSSATPR